MRAHIPSRPKKRESCSTDRRAGLLELSEYGPTIPLWRSRVFCGPCASGPKTAESSSIGSATTSVRLAPSAYSAQGRLSVAMRKSPVVASSWSPVLAS
jgi:hypothetical protein